MGKFFVIPVETDHPVNVRDIGVQLAHKDSVAQGEFFDAFGLELLEACKSVHNIRMQIWDIPRDLSFTALKVLEELGIECAAKLNNLSPGRHEDDFTLVSRGPIRSRK